MGLRVSPRVIIDGKHVYLGVVLVRLLRIAAVRLPRSIWNQTARFWRRRYGFMNPRERLIFYADDLPIEGAKAEPIPVKPSVQGILAVLQSLTRISSHPNAALIFRGYYFSGTPCCQAIRTNGTRYQTQIVDLWREVVYRAEHRHIAATVGHRCRSSQFHPKPNFKANALESHRASRTAFRSTSCIENELHQACREAKDNCVAL